MTSLFDSMDFNISLQPEDYLDQTFGLSAEILAADLNTDGGILDLGHNFEDGLKSTNQVSSGVPDESIDDLLFQDKDGASFGEEWMENMDLSVFLDSDNLVIPPTASQPVEQTTLKEEKKNHAFDILKALLTGTISEIPAQFPASIPSSPEAEVPDVSFFSGDLIASVETLEDPPVNNHKLAEHPIVVHVGQGRAIDQHENNPVALKLIDQSSQKFGPVKLVQTPESFDQLESNRIKVEPDPDQSVIFVEEQFASPFSTDDLESLLSSGPTSPDDSITLHTVDSSQLNESFSSNTDSSFDTITIVDDGLIRDSKRKSKKQKSRASPYDSDDSTYLNKKDRKKMQNKNAATRYRVKKRSEKETLQQQENNLSDKNKELREKVESLQREITYMKELMNEIYKAKGVKQKVI